MLDEQWAATAKFTAGRSVDMIGACGGLLCLLDVRSCAVRIRPPASRSNYHGHSLGTWSCQRCRRSPVLVQLPNQVGARPVLRLPQAPGVQEIHERHVQVHQEHSGERGGAGVHGDPLHQWYAEEGKDNGARQGQWCRGTARRLSSCTRTAWSPSTCRGRGRPRSCVASSTSTEPDGRMTLLPHHCPA